jgi:hypothetical protein
MSVVVLPKPEHPDPQSGDIGLIAFLRKMGIDESEAEGEVVEAYNRLMKAIGRCERGNKM